MRDIKQLEAPSLVDLKAPTDAIRALEQDRNRICDAIDAYVTKTGIKYVPIEILKAIVKNKP